VVICLERGADLHTAQLVPLPLTVSCFNKIQIGFTFLVLAHLGSPGAGPLNGCVCVCCLMVVSVLQIKQSSFKRPIQPNNTDGLVTGKHIACKKS